MKGYHLLTGGLIVVTVALGFTGCANRSLECAGVPTVMLSSHLPQEPLACDWPATVPISQVAEAAKRMTVVSYNREARMVAFRFRAPIVNFGRPSADKGWAVFVTNYAGELLHKLNAYPDWEPYPLHQFKISPAGHLAMVGTPVNLTSDNKPGVFIRHRDRGAWERLPVPSGLQGPGASADWLADGRLLVNYGGVFVRQSMDGSAERTSLPEGRLQSVSPNGGLAAVMLAEGTMKVFSAGTGQEVCPGLLPRRGLPGVVWSPESRHLWAAIDIRSTVGPTWARLYDLESCKVVGGRSVLTGSGVSPWTWIGPPEAEAMIRFSDKT